MKFIFTFLLSLSLSIAMAQNTMFVHTATAGNISADLSYIDHPDLNGNPSAQLVVSHVWNPPGSSGVYNTHRTGLYYDSIEGKWGVYNEDASSCAVGCSTHNREVTSLSQTFCSYLNDFGICVLRDATYQITNKTLYLVQFAGV